MSKRQAAENHPRELWCRIQVWDSAEQPQVTVRMPAGLITAILRQKLPTRDIEQQRIQTALRAALQRGEVGRVYQGRASQQGERFEIHLDSVQFEIHLDSVQEKQANF